MNGYQLGLITKRAGLFDNPQVQGILTKIRGYLPNNENMNTAVEWMKKNPELAGAAGGGLLGGLGGAGIANLTGGSILKGLGYGAVGGALGGTALGSHYKSHRLRNAFNRATEGYDDAIKRFGGAMDALRKRNTKYNNLVEILAEPDEYTTPEDALRAEAFGQTALNKLEADNIQTESKLMPPLGREYYIQQVD